MVRVAGKGLYLPHRYCVVQFVPPRKSNFDQKSSEQFVSIMIWFIFLLAFLVISTIAAFWSKSRWASRLRPRLVTLYGIVIIVWGFFFLPWVHLGLISYFDNYLLSTILENIGALGNIVNAGIITEILDKVFNDLSLNGTTILLISLLGFRSRIAIALPPILAGIALVSLPFTISYAGAMFNKVIGALVSGGAFLNILIFIATLQHIDNLGTTHYIGWALLMALLGVHIDIGPFVTLLGLVLLFIGGMVDLFGTEQPQDDSTEFTEEV